jgi:hypothetical protein
MGDLSAFQKNETETVAAIYKWHEENERKTTRFSRRLGASIIGHECDRYLWFSFRWCFRASFDGRMLRLFKTGHLAEPRFVEELRGIGCEVHEVDETTGNQIEATAIGGHFIDKLDAVILGLPEAKKTWHVGEFKTFGGTESTSKDFEKLSESGVKKAKPLHYAQCQVGMGLTKMDRALYLAVKKATDELYSERIEFNSKEFKAIMTRAERIIKSNAPPERCTTRADDFRCKLCDASPLCWGTGETALPVPVKSCRTCCHATPEMDGDGRWSCKIHGELQECDCDQHLVLPQLISFADPIDAGDDWIKFENRKDKAQWVHGASEGQWTTKELMKTPAALVSVASKVKEALGATVVGFEVPELSLIDRYDPKDSRLLWEGHSDSEELESTLEKLLGCHLAKAIPTNKEDTADTQAIEYQGKYLVVFYRASNYVAVWGGVE